MYQIWTMPEEKVTGSHNKWIEGEIVEAESRKEVTKNLKLSHKNGCWKVRMV